MCCLEFEIGFCEVHAVVRSAALRSADGSAECGFGELFLFVDRRQSVLSCHLNSFLFPL